MTTALQICNFETRWPAHLEGKGDPLVKARSGLQLTLVGILAGPVSPLLSCSPWWRLGMLLAGYLCIYVAATTMPDRCNEVSVWA